MGLLPLQLEIHSFIHFAIEMNSIWRVNQTHTMKKAHYFFFIASGVGITAMKAKAKSTSHDSLRPVHWRPARISVSFKNIQF
jgi:hypothetical protein